MIITKKHDLMLLEFLIKNFYKSFTIEELSKQTKLSIPKLYKTINLFKKYLLIKSRINLYGVKINLNNIYVEHFKYLIDSEKILQLKEPFLSKIGKTKIELLMRFGNEIKSIILFGSVASEEYNIDSDVDLLIIRKDNSDELDLSFLDIEGHIIQKTKKEISDLILNNDDFIISILKNHIIYFDNGTFYNLLHNLSETIPEKQLWEMVSKRKQQLKEVKDRLFDRIKKNKLNEAVDFLKQYIILNSRIELLEKNEIPTTKSETLRLISELKKENIKKDYEHISEKNIKKMALKYVS